MSAPEDREGSTARVPTPRRLTLYQLAVVAPLLAGVAAEAYWRTDLLLSPVLVLWALGIAVVDLLPTP